MADEQWTPPPVPDGMGEAGTRWWRAIAQEFDLEPHELELVHQIVRCAEVAAQADEILATEGLVVSSSGGPKAHPAEVIARQNRQLLGRLVSSLRLPVALDDSEADEPAAAYPQHRGGGRGFYAVQGGDA